MQYPNAIRIIRVPCTGKVDVIHILRSFEKGADGVYVVGCIEGECHYRSGNFSARKHVEQAQKILDTIGLGAERAQMYNLSSAEGTRFAEIAREMTAKICALGPNPIKLSKLRQVA